jgi:31-O-methyltransferase
VPAVTDRGAQERIRALDRMLRHYDRSQLAFQLVEIAGERTYLRHGVTLEPGAVVLDVGANVGVAAAFFAAQCGAAVVHSFEPVAPLFELLRANVAALPACVAHPYGLGAADRRAEITFYRGAGAMSGLYAEPARDRDLVRTALRNLGVEGQAAEDQLAGRYEPERLECELRTLSRVLREEGIGRVDLLKVDVERAELDVLAGLAESDWPAIRQLVVEVHDEDGRATALAEELRGRGFRVACDEEPAMRGTGVRLLFATRR